MKKIILGLTAVILLTTAGEVWGTTYTVGPGEQFGIIDLRDDDTLLMTGGEGEGLTMGGTSIATIEDTNPLIGEGNGGIWRVSVGSSSVFNLNGGEINAVETDWWGIVNMTGGSINELIMDDETLAFLTGGQLDNLTVTDIGSWVHIFGYGFNNDPFSGSPLTGYWADDTAFSINLIDDGISTYDQIIFHEIPEPGTLLLFGLGAFFLRSKERS